MSLSNVLYKPSLHYVSFSREDLKYWIVQMAAQRQSNPETAGDNLGKPDDIMETIISVQKQQDDVLERLRNEQVSFEQELSKGMHSNFSFIFSNPVCGDKQDPRVVF